MYKNWVKFDMWFLRYKSGQTDRQLDGKYSERVQLPAKTKFVFFCRQHLPHLLLEV